MGNTNSPTERWSIEKISTTKIKRITFAKHNLAGNPDKLFDEISSITEEKDIERFAFLIKYPTKVINTAPCPTRHEIIFTYFDDTEERFRISPSCLRFL